MADGNFNTSDPNQVFPGNPLLIELGKAILREEGPIIARLVTQSHVPVNAAGVEGISPLMFATLNKRAKAIDALMKLGADPWQWTSENANLGSPISLALRATKGPDMLAVMLSNGASIEGGQEDDEPLIFTAILLPSDARLRQLIAAGANLNIADSVGDTPLEIALTSMQFEKFEMLLDAKANPFLGTSSYLESLVSDLDRWKPGSSTYTQSLRLIEKLKRMGLQIDTEMQPAPTRAQLKKNQR